MFAKLINIKKHNYLLVILTISWLFLSGCTHALHMYHVNSEQVDFKYKSKKKIEAESEQFVIMSFTKQTNYVNAAFNELQSKCRNGNVVGIQTRYSTSHGFFSWTNKILMQAYCIR